MLKTFALRGRELPLTRVRAAGAARASSIAAADLREAHATRSSVVELRAGESLERDGYRVLVFPVAHGVGAVGYALVEDARPGRFDVAAADALGVPPGRERGALQRGESVTLPDGRTVEPEQVLGEAAAGRKVVYTGDTAPSEVVVALRRRGRPARPRGDVPRATRPIARPRRALDRASRRPRSLETPASACSR